VRELADYNRQWQSYKKHAFKFMMVDEINVKCHIPKEQTLEKEEESLSLREGEKAI